MIPCRRSLAVVAVLAILVTAPLADLRADGQTVRIGWLSKAGKRSWPASHLDQPPGDEGLQGARLAVADDNTTGRFTGQTFALIESLAPEGGDAAAFRGLAANGMRLVVSGLDAPQLLALAALPDAARATIFNTAAADDRLRGADCRANILHMVPSRAMLADALIQYFVIKRWR